MQDTSIVATLPEHIRGIYSAPVSLEAWELLGSPHTWQTAESLGIYTVLIDVGYCLICLLENGVYATHSKDVITYKDIMVVKPDVYCTPGYIYTLGVTSCSN